jgi:hypothetical protein
MEQLSFFGPTLSKDSLPKFQDWKRQANIAHGTAQNVADSYRTQFQTPIPVAKYMVSLIPREVLTVLEPTPGEGNIVSLLKDYQVTAPQDFFAQTFSRHDCVVMNPPFSSKFCFNLPENFEHYGMRLGYFIMTECMKISDNVIALMPWFTISDSDRRLRECKEFGLRSITALPRKTFRYARIQTCVLQMERGFSGTTEFKTFNF